MDDAPPPPRRFHRPVFYWLFGFVIPVGMLAGTLSLYVHEFAHGLAALATGGHFLGIKGMFLSRRTAAVAYADAWSEGYDGVVFLAGIVVNVIIGFYLFRRARRTEPLLPRLLLLHFASAFLGDLHYAYEGSLHWKTSDYDLATLLSAADSPSLRSTCLILSFLLHAGAVAALARALLDAWQEVFGGLSAGRAFWVILVLVDPVPTPTLRLEGSGIASLVALALFIGLCVWLIRGRRRGVEARPTQTRVAHNWLGGLIALAALAALQHGLRFGTYPDVQLFDLRVEEKAVAGFAARYGMGDRQGMNRPVSEPRLFVSTPDDCRFAPSPVTEVVDLAWLPESRRFLVVSAQALHEVSLDTGMPRLLWSSPAEPLRAARHGPDGQLLLALGRRSDVEGSRPSLYAYDAKRGRGELHDTEAAAGNPFFTPGTPVQAYVTVEGDLRRFTWGAREVEVDLLKDASAEGWFEGYSSGKGWFGDVDGWRSGSARVSDEGLSGWGVGAEGFVTISEAGRWWLTPPADQAPRGGSIDARAFRMLYFPEGRPWVVFRGGEVRPLEAPAPAFRVRLPPS